jgi:pimeloyl-ACP methyl ester carboxylesterase
VSNIWTRRREDVGGLSLSVRELRSGPSTLVLLHGLGASGAVWQGIGRRFDPGLRLLAPDLRGHGDSDKPSAGYLPRDYAGDVTALLAHDGAGPVDLLGHSLGAIVASLLAAERPELVRRLVLVDPPFDPDRPRDHVATVSRLRHEPPGELERYLQQREPGMGDLYARALADLFRAASDGAFEAALRTEPGFPAVFAALGSVCAPTLLIAADPALDGALGHEMARATAAALPRGRLVDVPGGRHAVHASHPRQFVDAVTSFLSDEASRS